MRLYSMLPTAAAMFAAAAIAGAGAASAAETRISGPHIHDNLAVYFVHGRSAEGPAPLTLAEALAKGSVNVIETGSVNELKIENIGNDEIFIQSGDIVKGGKQDRVLTVSLLLPAKSGKVPIASFCVEQGRWTARGKEDVGKFSSSAESMPSRTAKLAMMAPSQPSVAAAVGPTASASIDTASTTGRQQQQRLSGDGASDSSSRQKKVWDEVANMQLALSAKLGATVTATQSATSLQLALENDKLKEARAGYVKSLADVPKGQGEVVGYVFAVNGRLNSADIYPSNALFSKMWTKLLNASITEAIGERTKSAAGAAPAVTDVEAFLKAAEAGKSEDRQIAKFMRQETRDADKTLYVEAKRGDGRWVHRNYLAK